MFCSLWAMAQKLVATAGCWASLSFPASPSLLEPMSIELGMPSNHLILCHPLLLLLQLFPSIRKMCQLFASGGQSIGASLSVLPMNVQGKYPLELTGLISLQSKELSRVFSGTTVEKHQLFDAQPSLWSNSQIHTWLLGTTIALTIQTFVGKVVSLLFNTLSRLVIAFLARSKHHLQQWFWRPRK